MAVYLVSGIAIGLCLGSAAMGFMLKMNPYVNNIIIDRDIYEKCQEKSIEYNENIEEACDEIVKEYLYEVAHNHTEEVIDPEHLKQFLLKNF